MPTPADLESAKKAYVEANKIVDEVLVRATDYRLPTELEKHADPNGTWYKRQRSGLVQAKLVGTKYSAHSVPVAIEPNPTGPDSIRLFVCVDGRKIKVTFRDTEPSAGVLLAGYISVARQDDRWRVSDYASPSRLKEVSNCADGR